MSMQSSQFHFLVHIYLYPQMPPRFLPIFETLPISSSLGQLTKWDRVVEVRRRIHRVGSRQKFAKLTTVALGRLINTTANVILLQHSVKYYILLG